MSDMEAFARFYANAFEYSKTHFQEEIDWARNVKFEDLTADKFLSEYVWTVLCSGFKSSIAEKTMRKVFSDGFHSEVVKHRLKRKAIEQASREFPQWFARLKDLPDKGRIDYLDSLPHIGPITKYHLARNIGLDFAKPDVHLVRLAKRFGFTDVETMCSFIRERTKERIGVVDLVLWRYCEQGQPSPEINSPSRHPTT